MEKLTAKVAKSEDFSALGKIMSRNCQRMNLNLANYLVAAEKILSDLEFGVAFMAQSGDEVVGFMMFTYEWSDWRDGVMFWMQCIEGDSEVLQLMKQTMTEHCDKMEHKLCGIRLCSEKVIQHENQAAVDLFQLKSSHYYVYHVDAK